VLDGGSSRVESLLDDAEIEGLPYRRMREIGMWVGRLVKGLQGVRRAARQASGRRRGCCGRCAKALLS
jgi:hypothetical protein